MREAKTPPVFVASGMLRRPGILSTFPAGLKPARNEISKDLYGAAEQAAEKVGKADPSGAEAPSS